MLDRLVEWSIEGQGARVRPLVPDCVSCARLCPACARSHLMPPRAKAHAFDGRHCANVCLFASLSR